MSFSKGKMKTGGRKKGTPNKTTKVLRDLFKAKLEPEYQNLDKLFESLDADERINAIIKLPKFVLPTVAPVQVSMDSDEWESIFVK